MIGANGFAVSDGDDGRDRHRQPERDRRRRRRRPASCSPSAATNGHFELVSAPGVAITSFTQAQILAGEVRFVHDGSNSAPAITVYVTDGVTNAGPFTTNITFTGSGTTIARRPAPAAAAAARRRSRPLVPPPASHGQPRGPQDPGAYARSCARPTEPPDDGGDDGASAEVGDAGHDRPAGVVLDKRGVPMMGMPTVRAERETIETKPLRSEVEVEPIRAEMQVLPMRQQPRRSTTRSAAHRGGPELGPHHRPRVLGRGGVVGRARGRPDGEPARLLARLAPRRPAAGPRPRRRGRGGVGRVAEEEDQERKDDEHRAAWVLEEREAGS